jgi:hypothetical protein
MGRGMEGEAHRWQWCLVAAVVNDGFREAFNWVLHNEDYINSTSQHQKGESGVLTWRLTEEGSQLQCGSDM